MSFRSPRWDVRWIVLARSLSWLGDEVATVALLLRLQSHGHGALAVAALLIANALPIVALSGVVGRLVDRHDNRRLLIVSSLAQALACAALALCVAGAAPQSLAPILVLVALLGVGQAVNGACWQALLGSVVDGDALTRAIGHSQAGRTVAGVVAPALSGLLVGWCGTAVPLGLDAVAYLAVTGAALLIATRRVPAPAGGVRQPGGLAIVRRDGVLRPLLVLVGLFVLLASVVNVVDVFLIRQTLHASPTWYGLAGAALSVGALGGALLGGRLGGLSALVRGFVASTVLLSLAIAGTGLAPSIGWVLVGSVAIGVTNGVLNVTLAAIAMHRTAAAARGRVSATLTGLVSGTQIVALAAGGALAGALGPREIFVGAGVLGLLAPALLGRGLFRSAAVDGPTAAPAGPMTEAAAPAGRS